MKFKAGDKVRVKPSVQFAFFKRKRFEVAEVYDETEFKHPVMITRKGDYFCFSHDELELINEQLS